MPPKRPALLLPPLLAFTLLISGCSSTKLITSWAATDYNEKPFNRILIVAVMHNNLQTKVFEEQFAKRISNEKVTGIPSYALIDEGKQNDKDQIRSAVKETGADAALIARLVEIRKEERYVPPSYDYVPSFGYRRGFYDYYSMSHRTVYTPGYTTTDTIVELETTVFSTRSEKMIWAGSTRSLNPSSAAKVIDENAEIIIKDMTKAGLLD